VPHLCRGACRTRYGSNRPPAMSGERPALAFGPVPSRRLGRSLGINHIPPKTCSYACVYCQLGRTTHMQVTQEAFYPLEVVASAVKKRCDAAAASGEAIDYLTFVPDGEPTLDLHLGEVLTALKPLGIPRAIITNSSLVDRTGVREALMLADWVSLKLDAADEVIWRRVDRPHGHLDLGEILTGARIFAQDFAGTLVTETMLVRGVNDGADVLAATADAIADLRPDVAYLGVPTRPPAETWVHPPDQATLNLAYQLFADRLPRVELLIGYEGNAFAATGNAAADLLSITAVHPMREEAVAALLARYSTPWEVVEMLTARGALVSTEFDDHTFYLRSLRGF
jgi:wyosine [tRNA(Phe)-imidazoG37] synthetase (radical SAM superfamily)